MKRHYLFFATLSYAYSILRPLQAEIWRRGDEVAWFLEPSCPDLLLPGELRIKTIAEAISYNPIAVFAPGNYIYPFLPGVKVEVFHGYPINKRKEKGDPGHFRLRGWFDIYCTQGEASTVRFQQLSERHGYFKVYETGWPKTDTLIKAVCNSDAPKNEPPTVLYGTTFTRRITSAYEITPVIREIAQRKNWKWILTLHPKLTDPALIAQFKQLAADFPQIEFLPNIDETIIAKTDVMLCDSSSIIVEYMLTNRPVVTLRNTNPGNYLIDVQHTNEIEAALERAMARPKPLMDAIKNYTGKLEGHRDGQNSARVLDAVDDFIAHHQGRMKRKPLNLVRKLKLRWKLKYFKW